MWVQYVGKKINNKHPPTRSKKDQGRVEIHGYRKNIIFFITYILYQRSVMKHDRYMTVL